MPKSSILASSLLIWVWATDAHAVPIPGLFNTGVDDSNVPLAAGSVEPHYALIASADPAFPGPAAVVASVIPSAYWMANSTSSQWIAPAVAEGYPSGGEPHPEGDYIFRLSFDLTEIDPSTASITGTWGVDNNGTISLNGVATGNTTDSYNPLVTFSISDGFTSGINLLDFVIHNLSVPSGSNPTGVRVEIIDGTGSAVATVGTGGTSSTGGTKSTGGTTFVGNGGAIGSGGTLGAGGVIVYPSGGTSASGGLSSGATTLASGGTSSMGGTSGGNSASVGTSANGGTTANSGTDAGTLDDAGPTVGNGADGGPNGAATRNSSCGCRIAGSGTSRAPVSLGIGLLFLFLLRRRRTRDRVTPRA